VRDTLRTALGKIKPPKDGKMHFLPDGTVGGLGVMWAHAGNHHGP
jgi:hypothetical protein